MKSHSEILGISTSAYLFSGDGIQPTAEPGAPTEAWLWVSSSVSLRGHTWTKIFMVNIYVRGYSSLIFRGSLNPPKCLYTSSDDPTTILWNTVMCLLPMEEEVQVGYGARLRAHSQRAEPGIPSCVCLPPSLGFSACYQFANSFFFFSFRRSLIWIVGFFFFFLINWAICMEGNKLLTQKGTFS